MMNKTVSEVVKSGLCTSCGVCKVACAKKCIQFKYGQEKNVPYIDESICTECGLCYSVCPGKGLPLNFISDSLWKETEGVCHNKYCGYALSAYTGYSQDEDIRFHSASGGVVSQFLIYLLEKGIVDGAIVVRFNIDNPLEPEPFIATTKDEILNSRGSKYVVLSYDKVLEQALAFDGKLVVVGMPCQIQGLRLLCSKKKTLSEKIIGFFSIYCSLNKTKHSIDYYLYHYKIERDKIGKFAFRDDGCLGYMKIADKKGVVIKKVKYESYWHGTHNFFANGRCALCIDHFGELADISFGDIHVDPYKQDTIGVNSMITRSRFWDNHLKECACNGYILLKAESLDVVVSSQPYSKIYKKGAGIVCNFKMRSLIGKKNPDYDTPHYSKPRLKNYISEISKAWMRHIGHHRSLWFIVHFLDKSK